MTTLVIILAVLAAAGAIGSGLAVWLAIRSKLDGKRVANARDEAKGVLNQAEEEKRNILLGAQEEVLKLRTSGERELKEQRQELTPTGTAFPATGGATGPQDRHS